MSKSGASIPKRNNWKNLQRMTPAEANSIAAMFRMYDHKLTGRIPDYLAIKLITSLGVTVPFMDLPHELNVNEVVSLVDRLLPETEPMLVAALNTFENLSAIKLAPSENQEESEVDPDPPGSNAYLRKHGPVLTPQCIANFMEGLGRPPISMSEATLMLNAMLDYDDCSEVPMVATEVFSKEITNFAKKSNAFKDYRL